MYTTLGTLKQEGIQEGIYIGIIKGMIKAYQKEGLSDDMTVQKLACSLNSSKEEAKAYFEMYVTYQNQENQDFSTIIREFQSNNGKLRTGDYKLKFKNHEVSWETMSAFGAASGCDELIEFALKNEGQKVSVWTALEYLISRGNKEGIVIGEIRGAIGAYQDMGISDDNIVCKLRNNFHINTAAAKIHLAKYKSYYRCGLYWKALTKAASF